MIGRRQFLKDLAGFVGGLLLWLTGKLEPEPAPEPKDAGWMTLAQTWGEGPVQRVFHNGSSLGGYIVPPEMAGIIIQAAEQKRPIYGPDAWITFHDWGRVAFVAPKGDPWGPLLQIEDPDFDLAAWIKQEASRTLAESEDQAWLTG